MRAIALLQTYNEERFIRASLDHLVAQGLEVYLVDNGSTDRTLEIARSYLHRGLLGVETLPRAGTFNLRQQLERKQELTKRLDADWFMHVDADERHLPLHHGTLVDAFAAVEAAGCNAINFQEFTFIPTREHPDHDHPRFQETMRWYYPFLPFEPHLLRAWKRPGEGVVLDAGGHRVQFPNRRVYPDKFPMRHYPFLSLPHAVEKYVKKHYDEAELAMGWHGWRASLKPETLQLPSETELRPYGSDATLDASNPRSRHYLEGLELPHTD